jgi:hypothetical protein
VRRSGGTGINAATVTAVFGVPVDGAGSAGGADDTRVVFKVLGSTVPVLDPDTPQTEQIKVQYQNAFADELLSAYLNEEQSRLGVRINPAAFNAAIGSGS